MGKVIEMDILNEKLADVLKRFEHKTTKRIINNLMCDAVTMNEAGKSLDDFIVKMQSYEVDNG